MYRIKMHDNSNTKMLAQWSQNILRSMYHLGSGKSANNILDLRMLWIFVIISKVTTRKVIKEYIT